VVAAIYHDVLATCLHGFSDELNYPEAMRTSGGVSGRFNLSKYDSCVFTYAKPPMRRAFQFGITYMTGPGCWPPRGNVTSLLSRGATGPVAKGITITLAPLTELMQVFVSKTDLIRDPRVAFNGLKSS
jgi:hypothetical protein